MMINIKNNNVIIGNWKNIEMKRIRNIWFIFIFPMYTGVENLMRMIFYLIAEEELKNEEV